MTMPAGVDYQTQIDWVEDGFGAAPDDVSDDVVVPPTRGARPLAVEYGRDAARSLAPPMLGAADFTLTNEDRTYSPETAGALYQVMRPGKPVRIRTLHGDRALYRSDRPYRAPAPYRGIGVFPLFYGALDSLKQRPEVGQRVVDVGCIGSAAKLLRRVVSVPIYQSITTGQAIGLVLDAADWPAGSRSIEIGDTTLRYFWVDERPAWSVLLEVLASEGAGALLYEDADGNLRFEGRNHRLTSTRSLTSQAAFFDEIAGIRYPYRKHETYRAHITYRATEGLTYKTIRYDPYWEDVVHRVTMPITQREVDAGLSVVWELGTTISLNVVGQPVTITARPTDPFLGAISPVAGTDYTVSGGTATVALTETTGRVAKLVLTDTSGSPVISGLQLRAQALRSVGETVIEASPQNPPYYKTLELRAWPEIDPNQAQSIANSVFARYANPIPRVEIDLANLDGEHMRAMLALRISDRVTIYNDHLGLSGDFYVETISHSAPMPGVHEMTLACEQVTATGSVGGSLWNEALWETAVWGT